MNCYPENIQISKNRFTCDIEGIIEDRLIESEMDVYFYLDKEEKWDKVDEQDFLNSLTELMYWNDMQTQFNGGE